MKSLDRAILANGQGGHPLPSVFPAFEQRKMLFRRGEVAMIAGQPGAGKSLLALWHATRWVKDFNLKGLYFSADSTPLVQASRALAMTTFSNDVATAEYMLESEDSGSLETLYDNTKGLKWSFEPDITYDTMHEELLAFQEMWGESPDFMVVDNLTDVDGYGEDEWGGMRRVMKGLTSLARTEYPFILVLHHTSEEYRDDPAPPRKAIHGKVSQKPALVITLGEGGGGHKYAAPVKNRSGPSDKSGRVAVDLSFNYSNMHFG